MPCFLPAAQFFLRWFSAARFALLFALLADVLSAIEFFIPFPAVQADFPINFAPLPAARTPIPASAPAGLSPAFSLPPIEPLASAPACEASAPPTKPLTIPIKSFAIRRPVISIRSLMITLTTSTLAGKKEIVCTIGTIKSSKLIPTIEPNAIISCFIKSPITPLNALKSSSGAIPSTAG